MQTDFKQSWLAIHRKNILEGRWREMKARASDWYKKNWTLKNGGQHVCDLVCGDYACAHFPVKLWEAGTNTLSLSEFEEIMEKRDKEKG